jgi:uncharacterized protein
MASQNAAGPVHSLNLNLSNGRVGRVDQNSTSASLDQQVTLNLTQDQIRKAFLPVLATKRRFNQAPRQPNILGTMGFLIPFTTTMICLLQWRGAFPNSFNAISGS